MNGSTDGNTPNMIEESKIEVNGVKESKNNENSAQDTEKPKNIIAERETHEDFKNTNVVIQNGQSAEIENSGKIVKFSEKSKKFFLCFLSYSGEDLQDDQANIVNHKNYQTEMLTKKQNEKEGSKMLNKFSFPLNFR